VWLWKTVENIKLQLKMSLARVTPRSVSILTVMFFFTCFFLFVSFFLTETFFFFYLYISFIVGSYLNSSNEGKTQDNVKPTFTERPVIRQSDDGTKVYFECRLVGEPKPTVTW
jgi:hypothetical protein